MSKPLRRQNLTYAEREVYRREVLNIPSPLDDWLQTNARMPRVAALKSYLLLSDVEAEYVTCRVEMEHYRVSIHSGSRLSFIAHCLLLRSRESKRTAYISQRNHRRGLYRARSNRSLPAPCLRSLLVAIMILRRPHGPSGPIRH